MCNPGNQCIKVQKIKLGNIYRQVVEFQKEVCAIRSQQNTLEIDRNRFGMKHI